MRFKRVWARLGLALGLALWSTAGQSVELMGSYVDYQVELKNLPSGAKGEGLWQISLTPLCRQLKLTQLVNLSVEMGKNRIYIVMVQEGDESADGLAGNYKMQLTANGQKADLIQSVTFAGKNQPGKMNLTVGKTTTTKDVPAGVMLVGAATHHMIDQLLAGKTDFAMKIIEPTAPDGVVEMRVEVLPTSPFSDKPLPADTSGALKGKSWFTKATITAGGASQEMKFQIHETGVTSRILANMSGIEMEMTARNITAFPKPGC